MTKTIKCPTCKKSTVWSSDNPSRPFCSERCKLIDLGAWADESYKVSAESLDQTDEVNPYIQDDREID